MKIIILFFLTQLVYAKPSLMKTEGCPFEAEIAAREGDKFVVVKMNGKDQKLIASEAFSLQAQRPITFTVDGKDTLDSNSEMSFFMTSMVMSSLPRLTVRKNGKKETCWVRFHEHSDKKKK